MTFSILVFDPITNSFGGASATGNICVGAWVLRAEPCSGVSASQVLTQAHFGEKTFLSIQIKA